MERLKSWKRDIMKERGGQGERMIWWKGIKQEKGIKGKQPNKRGMGGGLKQTVVYHDLLKI